MLRRWATVVRGVYQITGKKVSLTCWYLYSFFVIVSLLAIFIIIFYLNFFGTIIMWHLTLKCPLRLLQWWQLKTLERYHFVVSPNYRVVFT